MLDDDDNAFKRFIEEDLNFDMPIEDAPPVSDTALYMALPPDERLYPNLSRDIGEILALLEHEDIGSNYYSQCLTSLELETRAELERLISRRLRPGLPTSLSDKQLRSIIAYSMTMGWLVLSALQEKSQDDDGGLDLGDDLDNLEF